MAAAPVKSQLLYASSEAISSTLCPPVHSNVTYMSASAVRVFGSAVNWSFQSSVSVVDAQGVKQSNAATTVNLAIIFADGQ